MRVLLVRIVVHALIVLFGITKVSAQNIAPCNADPVFAQLDFLIGDWEVQNETGTNTFGNTTIEKVIDGCAITEKWSDNTGFDGMSLFYYSTNEQTWKQVWVTQTPKAFGGVKEATLNRSADGTRVQFDSSYRSSTGQQVMDRSIISLQSNGTLLHLIEVSFDNGSTWTESFKAIYKPSINRSTIAE